ncbi:MAG: hypothetical protein K5768_04095 [Firmicutes bacterium]|nr:hypothetical protein [Bacillota bacterium]
MTNEKTTAEPTAILDNTPAPTPVAQEKQTIEPTTAPVEPSDALRSEEIEERAVYDGDVSDTILAKLSAYYREYADGEVYCIYRADQYNYYLIFGAYENGTFSEATVVQYHVQSNYTTIDCQVTVTEDRTIRPDLSGDTGYVYSNIQGYLPSRYIDSKAISTQKSSHVVTICIVLCMIVAIIGIWFHKIRRRWL